MNQNRGKIWQARIRQWEQSGLSQRQFCDEHDLALSTFQWWRGRLKKIGGEASAAMVELPLAVNVGGQPSDLTVEVGQFKVTVRGTVDREQLRSVLDVLENR